VLEYKARLGLHRDTGTPALAALPERFAPVAESIRAEEVAAAAVTLLRDRQEVLPIDARRWNNVLVVGVSDNATPLEVTPLASALRARLGSVTARGIDGRTSGDEAAALMADAARATVVVMAVRAAVRSNQERISLPDTQQRYGQMLAGLEVPVVLVALGSPYVVSAFPDPGAAVVAYGWSDPLQRALARALTGEIPWRGKLPVSVPGIYPLGHGAERPALDATLQPPAGRPGALAPADLAEARAVLQRFVGSHAFPGATYAIGHRNVLVELGAVGRMSYEEGAAPMPAEAVFDLASLTKVVATTTVAMKAVEAGRVRLDYPVRAYLPEFAGPGKDSVTVRHLLLHVAGLPPFVAFQQEYPADAGPAARAEILQRIHAIELEAPPGERYAYSDLGVILLGEVLERALGESYETFAAREIFAPLGMAHTRWRPPAEWLPLIPPTERDAWRGRLVHGEVHDESAALLGGVAPHAGLFSSAGDLAVFAQMLLNYGSYDHRRVLARATVDRWTRRQDQPAGSSRALGWDTPVPGESWAMFSERAFGHTGFTGTSLWIDPQRELFVVLLTNRVHPTRDNGQIREARIAFHTAVVEAVDRAAAVR
jgi:CubicO group peptidase (beta-lactamase class C family)